jgi:hypothetical protein
MIQNLIRCGNFTSSEIVALTTVDRKGTGWGKPALTYIEETNFERKLGRSISEETNARPTTWGSILEKYVFGLLPLDYVLTSDKTDVHSEIPYWAGSKDGYKNDSTIFDIKCPYTLKSFCQLADPLYNGLEGMAAMNVIRDTHKDGEKFFWQLVSNAILNDAKYAELIIFMPYKSELDAIKMIPMNANGEDLGKYYWITMAGEDELPYLNEGGYYQNLNILRFEIPESDKEFLTNKVLEAGKLLIQL